MVLLGALTAGTLWFASHGGIPFFGSLSGSTLKHARPGSFAVAVARLAHDPQGKAGEAVRNSLPSARQLPRLAYMPLPFRFPGDEPAWARGAGGVAGQAAQLLQRTGAAVLLWGDAQADDRVQLNWSASTVTGRYAAFEGTGHAGRLPPLDGPELQAVLPALLLGLEPARADSSQAASLRASTQLLESLHRLSPRLNSDSLAATSLLLAGNWSRIGAMQSDDSALDRAAEHFRDALARRTRVRAPREWAGIQEGLGACLRVRAARDTTADRLLLAVAAFREALQARDPREAPLAWARTEEFLATTLTTLGRRTRDPVRLEEAVGGLRRVLQVHERSAFPSAWAATQNNLGVALAALGELTLKPQALEAAAGAFRNALTVYSLRRAPEEWAMVRNNLGNALESMGEREPGTARLEEAVSVYREVAAEYLRQRRPAAWAAVQNNLGTALRELGERGQGTPRLLESAAAFRAALREYRPDNAPWQHRQATANLARVEALIQAAGRKTARP